MVGLGLLPLAALARFFGVSDEQTFLMPTPYALIVGFVIGAAVCGIIGRSMGLLGTQDMLLSRALNRGYASPRARRANCLLSRTVPRTDEEPPQQVRLQCSTHQGHVQPMRRARALSLS